MKLIFAVVQTEDAEVCADALAGAGVPYTRFASIGGFLAHENVTLMLGVAEDRVESVFELFREKARQRTKTLQAAPVLADTSALLIPGPVEVQVGGATLFILPVEQFLRV